MVKHLTICFLFFCSAVISNGQPCPTSSNSEIQVARTHFKQKLDNRQFDDTLQNLTIQLEKQYQQLDCLEQWLKIHIEYYDNERRVSRASAQRWLEKNAKAFRSTKTVTEDSLMMMNFLKKGYNEIKLSRISEARRSYESALVIREKHQLGDPSYMATNLYKSLGNIYTRLGDTERAINYLNIAKDMCTPGYPKLGSIYADLGLAYQNQTLDSNTMESALKMNQSGLQLENLLPYNKALFLFNIATINLDMGNYDQSLIYSEKCLEVVRQFDQYQRTDPRRTHYYTQEKQWEFQGGIAELKAEIYALTSNPNALTEFERAIQLNQKAYETTHHRQIAKTYIKTGNYFLNKNQPSKAINYFQSALQCLLPDFQPGKVTDNPEEAELYPENSIRSALEGKANAMIALKENLPVALDAYNLILDVEEKLQKLYQFDQAKLDLFQEGRSLNEKAIEIANQLYKQSEDRKYLEAAFRFAENSKAALLLEALNRQKSALISGIPDSLMLENRTLNSLAQENQQQMGEIRRGDQQSVDDSIALVKLEEQQLQIYLQQQELQKHLATTYPDYSKLSYQRPAVSLLKLQEDLIKENEVFVEYFFGIKNVYAFVATQNNANCINLGASKQLNQQLLAFKKQLSSKAYSPTFNQQSFALFKHLVEPLQLPESTHKLTVVTDGNLNYLPLQAFRLADSDQATDYLIHKYLISYTYSADVYFSQLQESLGNKSKGMLAMAPIQFPKNKALTPLPLTEAFITHLSKEHNGQFILGSKATKRAFMDAAGSFETLVLATHAEAGQQPLIHFYDQSLSLNELYSQKLNASTAVLMACGTADGILEGSEGVMSLARALSYAGVPSVTSSLWEVSEESSTTIISKMLNNLKDGMDKDQALHLAQLEFINTISERPWRWAAFIHIGNTSALHKGPINWLGLGGGSAGGLLVLGIGWWFFRRKL